MLHPKGLARATVVLAFLCALAPAAASAAPVEGPSGEAFYTPPTTLPEGGAGTLVWYRPATVNLNVSVPSFSAWNVLYKSTNQTGEGDLVTGTVIVPSEAWTGSGSRPVVDYAEGTQGLGHQCAPSLQMAAGTEYDGTAAVAALRKGYAVDITDYQGYTNGATPSYIAGEAEAHAVLDIAKASEQLPSAGLSSSNPVVVWGYSQGGQAAGWSGQIAHSYAPELNLKGVAAGGVPGNLRQLAEFSEGSPGVAFGLDSIIGLAYAYSSVANPESTLKSLTTPEGFEDLKKLKGECAIQSLKEFHDTSFSSISKNHETFPETIEHNMVVEDLTEQQKLGTESVSVPVYHYHGVEDEFVPVKQDFELHQAWCALGVKDDFQLYPGDHLLTDPTSTPYVMKWIEERFEGKAAPSTCGLHSGTELPANARLTGEKGDLIVPLPGWQATGSVTDAKLGLALKVPAGATLSAEGDITSGTLSASLSVPPIEETISLFGLIPVTISGSLKQAAPITGHIELSNSGELGLEATGGAILTTNAISILGLAIHLGCHTSSPIELPLDIHQPVNALATGSISITDTVTIPSFNGCLGILGALTTGLLSGPGNTVTLTTAPPPPINW